MALEQLLGEALPEHGWAPAQLGVAHGCLGVRDPARHAEAACLASLQQAQELCSRVDPSFDAEDRCGAS
eukprot:7810014-Alexandrium_andersonii.AAC.1